MLLQPAETCGLDMSSYIDGTEIGELHIQIALSSPTTFVAVVLHAEFVHPHFHATCAASVVAHTNHHGFHLTERGVADDAHFVVRFVVIVCVIQLCVTCFACGFRLVTLMFQVGEDAEIDVEKVLLWPNGLAALGGVGVVVACGGELQRDFVFIIVVLVVATQSHEHTHLVVLQFGVTLQGVGVNEHLQVLVVAEVHVHGFVNGTCIACGKIRY